MNDLYNNNILSFINCDIFIDNSINRPVYQTHMKLPGTSSERTISATGSFKNQMDNFTWINWISKIN